MPNREERMRIAIWGFLWTVGMMALLPGEVSAKPKDDAQAAENAMEDAVY